jgi:hypothetical protein
LQRRKLKRSLKRNVQENGIQKESVRRRSEMAFGKFRPLLQQILSDPDLKQGVGFALQEMKP